MLFIRKNQERGRSQVGWLDSYHTFSFSEYHDPEFMGFGMLRVINEDTVQSGYGFGMHPHNNMEIISYVIEGALEHKDSMGNGSIILPGEIQRMSAGTGVKHSEFNHSKTELLHFLQIWIIPDKQSLSPGYEQKTIASERNHLSLIGSPKGGDNAVTIHQNVNLFQAQLDKKHSISYEFTPEKKGWIQLVKGSVDVNGQQLSAGDGAAILMENAINITGLEDATLLLFDL